MTNTRLTIATIPGDGIGTEVLPAATRVIDHAAAQSGVSIDWTWLDWGCDYLVAHGSMMPSDGIDHLRQSDAVFLGAVGRPDVADHESLWGLLIPIRRAFDQYVNLRPVRQFEGVPVRVTIPSDARIDMVIVRENTEGEYSELGGRFGRGTAREFAIQENVFTRTGSGSGTRPKVSREPWPARRTRYWALESGSGSVPSSQIIM